MRSKFSFLIVSLCFYALTSIAQVPPGFNYQAVAHDKTGQPISDQLMDIKINILNGPPDGIIVYTETHKVRSGKTGIFSVAIGQGQSLAKPFSSIDWTVSDMMIAVEIDEKGTGQFAKVGASKLLSVPYAFYAIQAASLSNHGPNNRALSDSTWLITGNSGTNSIVNFLGTTDFADLVFKTNGVERMRVSALGNIAIGTISASANFEVLGGTKFGDGSNYGSFSNSGDLTFKGTADYLVAPNAFAFKYANNEDFGLRFNSTDNEYEFTTSGSGSIFSLDAINGRVYASGRMGIGTVTPGAKLDVRGTAFIGQAPVNYAQFTEFGDLFFTGSADYLVRPNHYAFRYRLNENFGFFFNSTDGRYEFHDSSANPSFFVKAITGETFIGGKTGIGLSNPSEQLEVDGALKIGNTNTNNTGTLRWDGNDFAGYDGTSWQSLTEDGDNDATNEYQGLVLTGSALELVNAVTSAVDLAHFLDNTDQQTLYISGNNLGISNGNTVSLPTIAGPTGSTGPTGLQGNIGPQGLPGEQGSPGTQGPTGAQGNQGPVGVQGPQGLPGILGSTGATGANGPVGAQGSQGSMGPQGPQGLQGIPGNDGAPGSPGAEGPQGFQGIAGPQGIQGPVGLQGPVGTIGPMGPQGSTGPLIPGTINQTFRHNGSNWEANSLLTNTYTNIGIGTTNPGSKLHIAWPNAHFLFDGSVSTSGYTTTMSMDNTGLKIGHNSASRDIRFRTTSTDRMTITASGNVGVGTTAPSTELEVSEVSGARIRAGGGNGSGFEFNDAGTRIDIPAANTMAFYTSGIKRAQIDNYGNFSVCGKITATEMRVEVIAWCDYVFDEGYELPSLNTVECFIRENKHLPEIPPEKDVLEKGIDLGTMNIKLLKKVEELTLYTIDQEKQLEELNKKYELLAEDLEMIQNKPSH